MIDIEIQNPADLDSIPKRDDLLRWVSAALQTKKSDINSRLVIRFVDNNEGCELNQRYRQKQGDEIKATNILSFPAELEDFGLPELIELKQKENYLGDLVLCEPIVSKEAETQKKSMHNHWAHLIIHGTLHLQGYDHIKNSDALKMEALEVKILKRLGFDNPYEVPDEKSTVNE